MGLQLIQELLGFLGGFGLAVEVDALLELLSGLVDHAVALVKLRDADKAAGLGLLVIARLVVCFVGVVIAVIIVSGIAGVVAAIHLVVDICFVDARLIVVRLAGKVGGIALAAADLVEVDADLGVLAEECLLLVLGVSARLGVGLEGVNDLLVGLGRAEEVLLSEKLFHFVVEIVDVALQFFAELFALLGQFRRVPDLLQLPQGRLGLGVEALFQIAVGLFEQAGDLGAVLLADGRMVAGDLADGLAPAPFAFGPDGLVISTAQKLPVGLEQDPNGRFGPVGLPAVARAVLVVGDDFDRPENELPRDRPEGSES